MNKLKGIAWLSGVLLVGGSVVGLLVVEHMRPAAGRTIGKPATKDQTAKIVQAVKAQEPQPPGVTFFPIDIVGDNARGTAGVKSDDAGGFVYFAHRDGNAWKVIYGGQELPGNNIGKTYGLPADWYSTHYDTPGSAS